jgi:Tfp pilus assembly protein PilV
VRRQVRQRRASGDSLLAVMVGAALLLAIVLGVVLSSMERRRSRFGG